MSKNKLAKFEENKTFSNLFQHTDYESDEKKFPLTGRWRIDYFKNENPIILELGCGKGDYTIALAERFPEKNFIGIDRKGARLWRGAKTAVEDNLQNVAFLRVGIDQIERFFGTAEVDEIWITFPDPQPKKERRRLTSLPYINRYRKILKNEALLHLKTDSPFFYEFSIKVAEKQGFKILKKIEDVYADASEPLITNIQTFYEKIWLAEGRRISYLLFKVV
jgi:tRNA (guanine-N7-)-methyltransferase